MNKLIIVMDCGTSYIIDEKPRKGLKLLKHVQNDDENQLNYRCLNVQT